MPVSDAERARAYRARKRAERARAAPATPEAPAPAPAPVPTPLAAPTEAPTSTETPAQPSGGLALPVGPGAALAAELRAQYGDAMTAAAGALIDRIADVVNRLHAEKEKPDPKENVMARLDGRFLSLMRELRTMMRFANPRPTKKSENDQRIEEALAEKAARQRAEWEAERPGCHGFADSRCDCHYCQHDAAELFADGPCGCRLCNPGNGAPAAPLNNVVRGAFREFPDDREARA